MQPEVEIEGEQTQPLVRGIPRVFTARVRDNDTKGVSFQWGHLEGICPSGPPSAQPSSEPSPNTSWAFTPGPLHLGVHCIWVRATDRLGAFAYGFTTIKVVNRPPSAQLLLLPPSSLAPVSWNSEVRMQVHVTDPDLDDSPQPELTLTTPEGQGAVPMPCRDGAPDAWCFHPRIAGTWNVQLVAVDPWGARSAPASLDVTVEEDQPPCGFGTPTSTRLVQEASLPLRLEVRVVDDRDSLPSLDSAETLASLRWSLWENEVDGWTSSAAVDQRERSFRIPADRFRPGDQVLVRVEIADRVPRAHAPSCTINSDECALATMCSQRLTWTVDFR